MVSRRILTHDPIAQATDNWIRNGWSTSAPGMATVTSIMRAHQILLARVHQALKTFDLTFAQYEALMLLSFTRAGRMPLSKVGQRLQVHPASVTNVIDRLEGKGLVERKPHPDDNRTTLAAITRKGRNLARRATAQLNVEVFDDIGIAADRQHGLVEIITELRRSAGDFEE